MKPIKTMLLLLAFLVTFGVTALAQEALTVYGNGWSFMVSEPSGWSGVTADANRYQVNIYFPMPGYDLNSSPVLMYGKVLEKNGNTMKENLKLDMLDFSNRKKSIEFLDYSIGNLNYEYASKKYIINHNQVDYLCYIDPGSTYPYYVIFVLTGPKGVCENHLDAFLTLTHSFKWLNMIIQ